MTRSSLAFVFALAALAATASGCSGGTPADMTNVDASVDAAPAADLTTGPDLAPYPQPFMPELNRHSGSILDHPGLVTITYMDTENTQIAEGFGDFIFSSQWIHTVGDEYGYKAGKHVAKVELPIAAPGSITDKMLTTYINSKIKDATLPSPEAQGNDQLFYFLYFPQTTKIQTNNNQILCTQFAGYHSSALYNKSRYYYAVIGNCYPFTSGQVTVTASHELIEGATDAVGGGGYYLDVPDGDPWQLATGQEDGDMCEYEPSVGESGYELQKNYSSKAARAGLDPCVPSDRKVYENVFVLPAGVPSVAAGATVTFSVVGWGIGAPPPWKVKVQNGYRSSWSATDQIVSPVMFNMYKAGVVQVTLTVPADASSGQLGGVLLYSTPSSHFWPLTYVVQ